MKIVDVSIVDYRSHGEYRDPVVTIRVDEDVYEQAAPVFDARKSLQFRVIPCGPFFAVEYREDLGDRYSEWADYSESLSPGAFGELNSSGLIKEQLIPVRVKTPRNEVLHLAMSVARVRRLLRRFKLDRLWFVLVDEQAAMFGSLEWRVELLSPVCYGGAVPRAANCLDAPTGSIVQKGAHLSLCPKHAKQHEARMRRARIAN